MLSFNAIDNTILPSVEIHYTVDDIYIESVITDAAGKATIFISSDDSPTLVTYNATKDGFVPSDGSLTVTEDSEEASLIISLTPELKPDQTYRLVMNWGEHPSDLDLHVTQYSKSDPAQPCETYYHNMRGCNGLYLDVDNTQGGLNGAETITWEEGQGDYFYLLFVFDFII